MRQTSSSAAYVFLLTTALTTAQINGPVYTSSFTWNANCGPTVACGPAAAGSHGIGFAAANNVTFAAAQPIVDGKGAACGQCWHLTPQANAYQGNGKSLGTSVVVKINDQCTDPKYCDQEEFGNKLNLNTGYDMQVHFDLCNSSGVTDQFFGQIGIGVATGLAQQVDCSQLENGPYGSGLGDIGSNVPIATSTENEKSAKHKVGAGNNNVVALPGSSSSSSSSPVGGGQSSTMATVVSSSATPNASTLPEDSQDNGDDECDEL